MKGMTNTAAETTTPRSPRTDGSTGSINGFPAHGLAVLAVGAGKVDMVQAAKITGLRERAAAVLKKLLET